MSHPRSVPFDLAAGERASLEESARAVRAQASILAELLDALLAPEMVRV